MNLKSDLKSALEVLFSKTFNNNRREYLHINNDFFEGLIAQQTKKHI
jgi:hypothetical protein